MNSLKGLEIKGRRKEIVEAVEKNPDAEKIVLKTKPSKFLFLLLLNRTKMKKILASKAVYKSIARKYWKVLEEMGVKKKSKKKKKGEEKLSEKNEKKNPERNKEKRNKQNRKKV